MVSHDPTERALASRIAACDRWANTPDRAAATEPARRGLLARFEREVDPDGTLPPTERARRAELARRAFYARLALKSAQARRKAKTLTAEAIAAETELAASGGDAA